jgi:hypothetical protein
VENGAIEFDGTDLTVASGSKRFPLLRGIRADIGGLDFASVADGAFSATTVSVTGALVGDFVIINEPAVAQADGVYYTARVSASNTVKVVLHNESGSSFDPASGTFRICVIRSGN